MHDERKNITTELIQINTTLGQGLAIIADRLCDIADRVGTRSSCEQNHDQDTTTSATPQRAAQILTRLRNDSGLRFPHRKIMDVLINCADPKSGDFAELNFSTLVKRARVSKGRASGYLSILKEKGLIQERRTPYQTFYRAAG